MADEPVIKSGVDFLNHVTSTLDRCSGQWEWYLRLPFWDVHSGSACVRFLNTGRIYDIEFNEFRSNGPWRAFENSEVCLRITGLLNGQMRDEAGNLSSPLRVEAGKWYERRDGKVVGPACQLQVRMQNDFHKWIVSHIYYGDCGRGMSDGSDWHGDLFREVPAPVRNEVASS